MKAIIPNVPTRSRPYAWGSIMVNPDPPRVGEIAQIQFPLANPGPDEIVVERIEARVALFGLGVRWDPLPEVGPYRLPPDPQRLEYATIEWTPWSAGHRCVRAAIYVKGIPQPCEVGRNLHVIEAAANEEIWSVPFRLGNPEDVAGSVLLRAGGNERAALDMAVRIRGTLIPLDGSVWLEAHEEVAAEMVLRARVDTALSHLRTLEASIRGGFIDGIEVTVRRPSYVALDTGMAAVTLATEEILSLAR